MMNNETTKVLEAVAKICHTLLLPLKHKKTFSVCSASVIHSTAVHITK